MQSLSTQHSAPRNILAANLICLASMLAWAAGLPAVGLVIPHVPPVPLTALRCLMATALLLPVWLLVEGWQALRHANWGQGLWVGGLGLALAALLLVVAQAATDAVTVAIVSAVTPIVGIALEVVLEGRKLTLALILGLCLSLVGGLVAFGAGVGGLNLGLGALAALGSVLVYTWGSRASVSHFPDLSPLGRTAITVTGAAVVATAVALGQWAWGVPPPDWAGMGLREWSAMSLYGFGSLAISQLLWIMAVGALGIGMSSLHLNAVPFYVMVIGFAFGQGWNWTQALGAGIVVLGVVIAQGLLKARP